MPLNLHLSEDATFTPPPRFMAPRRSFANAKRRSTMWRPARRALRIGWGLVQWTLIIAFGLTGLFCLCVIFALMGAA